MRFRSKITLEITLLYVENKNEGYVCYYDCSQYRTLNGVNTPEWSWMLDVVLPALEVFFSIEMF